VFQAAHTGAPRKKGAPCGEKFTDYSDVLQDQIISFGLAGPGKTYPVKSSRNTTHADFSPTEYLFDPLAGPVCV
jgi:hypothetical protein